MGPTQELIDELYVDKVLAARQRTFEQKFLAGGELHEAVIERMKMGILMQNPNATEEEVAAELSRRYAIARILENRE
ncbi:MAG: hypothetical protein FWD61_19595 [Phycisphaerales bacterium]|nr:hypothetical protein [Phycisphaerales bacterium]